MYPFLRLAKELRKFRNAPPLRLAPESVHVSHHRCWPWDLDFLFELNNGRTLTLYDLARVPFGHRTGIYGVLGRKGWGIAVAGNTVRYRHRARAFDLLEIHTRCLGWDARFFYIEQSMWRGTDCTSHMLIRSAITDAHGIVPPDRMLAELDHPNMSPVLPDWVASWIAADRQRPWPPSR